MRTITTTLLILVMCTLLTTTTSANYIVNSFEPSDVNAFEYIEHTRDYDEDYTQDTTIPPNRFCVIVFELVDYLLCTDKPRYHCTDCRYERIMQSCLVHISHIINVGHTTGSHPNVGFYGGVGVVCTRCGYVISPI